MGTAMNMEHTPDRGGNLLSGQNHSTGLWVFLGSPEIFKKKKLKKSCFSHSHHFLATSEACSKNPCRSNRCLKGKSGYIHHKMHFQKYNFSVIFCKYLRASLPPRQTVAYFNSARFGKMALTHITLSIPQNNKQKLQFFPLRISSRYTRQ